MKSAIKKTKQFLELRSLAKNQHDYNCRVAGQDSDLLLAAKKLHASVYLDLGFVDQTDINRQNIISQQADPHQLHATYFVVTNGVAPSKPVAAARQINFQPELGLQSFPIMTKTVIDKPRLSQIDSYDPQEIVEISALVKTPAASSLAPLVLYKFMLDYSTQHRQHKLWLMALDSNVYKKMKYHFGGVLVEIGNPMRLPGGDAIPIMIHTDRVFNLMDKEIDDSRLLQKQTRQLLLSFFKVDLGFEFED